MNKFYLNYTKFRIFSNNNRNVKIYIWNIAFDICSWIWCDKTNACGHLLAQDRADRDEWPVRRQWSTGPAMRRPAVVTVSWLSGRSFLLFQRQQSDCPHRRRRLLHSKHRSDRQGWNLRRPRPNCGTVLREKNVKVRALRRYAVLLLHEQQ